MQVVVATRQCDPECLRLHAQLVFLFFPFTVHMCVPVCVCVCVCECVCLCVCVFVYVALPVPKDYFGGYKSSMHSALDILYEQGPTGG